MKEQVGNLLKKNNSWFVSLKISGLTTFLYYFELIEDDLQIVMKVNKPVCELEGLEVRFEPLNDKLAKLI